MPKDTQHALITWIPQSTDGKREAINLNNLYRDYSVLIDLNKLTTSEVSKYMSLIVVGHHSEFLNETLENLVKVVQGSDCTWIVLAMCDSGTTKYYGTLENNELWSKAQKLSNRLKIKVSGTMRPLTFDEVGKGLAFALTLTEILIRSNPAMDSQLWKDFEPQNDVDEIIEGFKNI